MSSHTTQLFLVSFLFAHLQSCNDSAFKSSNKSSASKEATGNQQETEPDEESDETISKPDPTLTPSPELAENDCGITDEKRAELSQNRNSLEATIITPYKNHQKSRRFCISWLPVDGASHYLVVIRDLIRNEKVVFLRESLTSLSIANDQDLQDSTYAIYVQPFRSSIAGMWSRFTVVINQNGPD